MFRGGRKSELEEGLGVDMETKVTNRAVPKKATTRIGLAKKKN